MRGRKLPPTACRGRCALDSATLGPAVALESQNATSTTSAAGQRYLHRERLGTSVLLFVRETPTDELGAAPFLLLGPVRYVEHRGERPIAITWELAHPIPPDVLLTARAVAS